MFKLIQTSETRGDCTASYDIQLDKSYTIKELFEAVLENRADEWGTFYLMVRSKKLFWQNPSCEYKQGKRFGSAWANILMRYGERKITQVKADGGWTRMDYYIWLDEKPKPEEKPREEQKMKNELPTTDCLLVVQVPFVIKSDKRKEYCEDLHRRIVEMKKTGVVVLDGSVHVLVVPKDIEVRFESEKNENSEVKEGPDT